MIRRIIHRSRRQPKIYLYATEAQAEAINRAIARQTIEDRTEAIQDTKLGTQPYRAGDTATTSMRYTTDTTDI